MVKGKGKNGYGPRWRSAYAIPDYHGSAYALVGRRWVRFGGKGKGKGKGKPRAKGTHGKRRDEDEFYEQQRREEEQQRRESEWNDWNDCEWWNGQWWKWWNGKWRPWVTWEAFCAYQEGKGPGRWKGTRGYNNHDRGYNDRDLSRPGLQQGEVGERRRQLQQGELLRGEVGERRRELSCSFSSFDGTRQQQQDLVSSSGA